MYNFSKKEALRYGWGMMKKHFWQFAQIFVVVLVIVGVLGILSDDKGATSAILGIINIIVQMVISVGITIIALKVYEEKSFSLKDLYADRALVIQYFFASILYMLIVLAGFILLVFPGFMWMMKYQMYPYLIVDKKMKAWPALKESGRITKGSRWNLFFFMILMALVNMLGVIVFGIGLFVTMPLTLMAFVFVYKKLVSRVESSPAA